MAINITAADFKKEVIESDIPVLVDFWAEWCAPCKMVAPVLEELSNAYSGKLKVVKVNVDEEPDLAGNYGVVSIPTILLFKNGEVVKQHIGAAPLSVFEQLVQSYI
ncbi:thioredoxin [Spirochaetia bacterium 38H-sp]|uniref:Thioredoxin n=1 Tax=Rarispira pelagica TaxID=3141764 RepID=A0ABU9U9L9_9SPIR